MGCVATFVKKGGHGQDAVSRRVARSVVAGETRRSAVLIGGRASLNVRKTTTAAEAFEES